MGARSTDALVRLLAIRDWLATNAYFEPVPLDDVVRQFGGTRDKMLRDLNTLSVADDDTFDFDGRFWVDIDLLHDSGLVQLMSHIDANQLPGLTPSEALAIRIGLESLSSVLSRDLVERIPAVLERLASWLGSVVMSRFCFITGITSVRMPLLFLTVPSGFADRLCSPIPQRMGRLSVAKWNLVNFIWKEPAGCFLAGA